MLNKFGGFDSLHRCAIRLACTGHGWLGGCVLTIFLPTIVNYITLRFLGDNPPASYVFLPSLVISTIAIFLLKTGQRHPADISCLHQRWNRCILSAPRSGWFVNIKMSASTFYGLVSNQPLPQHLILISIIWQSGILRTGPQVVVTKAIMTTTSTCRSLWIAPKPYLGVRSIYGTWFGNYLDLIIPKLDLRLNTHSQ